MMKRVECIVEGRVQAVGFRYFVSRNAKRLGIFGTAENMADGTVKVVGEGEEESLNEFISSIKEGSMFTKVENVRASFFDSKNEFKDFRVIY